MFYSMGYFNNPFMFNNFMMPRVPFSFFAPNFGIPFFVPFTPFIPIPSLFTNSFSIFNISNFEHSAGRQPAQEVPLTPQNNKPVNNGYAVKVQQTKIKPPKKSLVKKELGPEFLQKTKQIAKNLNCNYKDLLALMNSESGINPKAVNKHTNATGLIQFMPKTVEYLGTSTEELKNMSAVEQLDYVEKYLSMMKKSAGFKPNDKLSGADLYALIFLPAYAKQDVLTQKSDGKRYAYNSGLDLDKDGKITKTDLAARITSKRVNESIFA